MEENKILKLKLKARRKEKASSSSKCCVYANNKNKEGQVSASLSRLKICDATKTFKSL